MPFHEEFPDPEDTFTTPELPTSEPEWVPDDPPSSLSYAEIMDQIVRGSAETSRLTREATAAENAKQREFEAWWRGEYNKFLMAQLAQTAADNAADRELKREALIQEARQNEQRLRLLRRQQTLEHQRGSAAATGYWVGPLGRGVA